MTWGSLRNITATTSWNLEHNLKFRKCAWRSELMLGSCVWTLLAFLSLKGLWRASEEQLLLWSMLSVIRNRYCRIHLCSGSSVLPYTCMSTGVEWEELSQRFQFVCFLRKERWKIPGYIFKVSLYMWYCIYVLLLCKIVLIKMIMIKNVNIIYYYFKCNSFNLFNHFMFLYDLISPTVSYMYIQYTTVQNLWSVRFFF